MKIVKLKDPVVKEARELSRSRNRIIKNRVQLRGREQLQWARDAGLKITAVFITEDDNPADYNIFSNSIYQTSSGILKKITETSYLIPCVGMAEVNESIHSNRDFVLILDDVKDHGNIGTIIRTGLAYGINKIITTSEEFDPYFPKTIDASRGTVFKTRFQKEKSQEDTVKHLKKEGYQIIATSPRGKSLQSMIELERKPVALVVGNESYGVSDSIIEQADCLVQIPMFTGVESLNVGVATGISVYELRIKGVLAMLEDKIRKTLGREINVASQLIREAFNIKLKEVNQFTGDQSILLMVLNNESRMNREQIIEQFGYSDTGLTEFLEPLFTAELIEEDYGDIQITDKGREYLSKIWPVLEKTEHKILTGISAEEEQELARLINKIKNNCLQILEYKL